MRFRTVLLLFIAIGLAGGTAMLARAWLAAQRAAEIAEAAPLALPTPAKSVLVARNELKRGQILKPEDMMWQIWPEGGLDKNYVVLGSKTPESFAGWVARNPVSAGEPITESKIISPANRGFLAAVLRAGMRAISVPVTITSGISGFIFPGDQVDLLITYQVPSGNTAGSSGGYEHKAAETVLHDVRVIAIDQRLESKAGEAVVAHTATLEVTPKQSEVIALAGEIGKLSLSLRSLVPAVADASTAAGSPDGTGITDSSDGTRSPTFTIDSEISPLLPKSLHGNDNSDAGTITILRGGGKGADSIASPAASRGS
jgi:pilus assembly protein CpaB